MKKKKFDPFKNLKLDKYEQEIEDALEREEFVPVEDSSEINKILTEAAKNYTELENSKSITLRIKNIDLIKLKAKAARNKIPYQTLINLLIKEYTEGKTKISL
ncbi:MAG: hypothetical protein HYW63_00835 [Candidatus Levybacteria bacterium]|nr:hypothetical protein [Candidatus Levybacteria bacterium]